MNKMWKVFLYEYKRHVFRKRFILVLLSMPFFVAIVMASGFLSVYLQTNSAPVGYIDQSGLLANPIFPKEEGDALMKPLQMIPYTDEAQARADLESEKIQAYFVLPPDYLETSNARLVALKKVDDRVQSHFADFLQMNLLADQPAEITQRFTQGPNLTIQAADGSRSMAESNVAGILVPLLAGILVIVVVMTSGGYLLQAVVEEKENRTMEIVITSISPDQLMAGKVLGNLSVGLTQLIIWGAFIVAGLFYARSQFEWAQQIQIGGDSLLLMLGVLLPTFVFISGLMAAIGATVTEAREAQQISGLFTLPIMVPYFFTATLMTNPNSPLALALSFFPLTSPVTLTLRAGFTQVPTWQIAVNVVILTLCAIVSIWLAARTFRLGMLSYGKRLSWKQIFGSQK